MKYEKEIPLNKLKSDEEITKQVEEKINNWFRYWKYNRENYQRDILFCLGDQWDSVTKMDYTWMQKIMLAMNIVYPSVMNIVGAQRQNSSQIRVRSLEGKASQKEINFNEGILRHIAYNSSSDYAYQTAFMCALMGGYGAWEIGVDYENDYSFRKIITINKIDDPNMCYWDCLATNVTKTNAACAGKFQVMDKMEFKRLYPEIEAPMSFTLPDMDYQNDLYTWSDRDIIIIADHYERISTPTTLLKLSSGDIVTKEEYNEKIGALRKARKEMQIRLDIANAELIRQGKPIQQTKIPEIKVVAERETEVSKVYKYKCIKNHVLEKEEFYGIELPIIYVDGDSHTVNGFEKTRSLIDGARDTQEFLNAGYSDIAQRMKNSRRATPLLTPDMIRGFEEEWNNPEKPKPFYLYNPDPKSPDGKPVFTQPEELPTTLLQLQTQLVTMIQNTLGRYEANQGQQSNETSGQAIKNRANEGDKSVFIFKSNLNRAIEQTGRICIGMIPDVYKENGSIHIKDRDGHDISYSMEDPEIKKFFHNIKISQFDVSVEAGSSTESQKDEQYQQIVNLMKLDPANLSKLLMDLAASNTDTKTTNQIVDRLRKFYTPPQVIAEEKGEPPPKPAPNPALELQQQEVQADMMTAKAKTISSIADVIDSVADLKRAEAESQNEEVRSDTELTKAQMDLAGKMITSMDKIESFRQKQKGGLVDLL
jgi:hypothetical protein